MERDIEARIKELGLLLPTVSSPIGSYMSCVQTGNLLFLSGILPFREGKLFRTGKVGGKISLAEAQEDAKLVVLNALAILKGFLGDLNKIKQCVRLNGYIASTENFTKHPEVLNPASDLLYEIFGNAGRHSRIAIGVSVLPLDSPLEIDFIFEISV